MKNPRYELFRWSLPIGVLASWAGVFLPATAQAQTINYTYDSGCTYCAGRLRSVTDGSGSTTVTYDERGRSTRVDKTIAGAGTYTTQATYDSLNRVVTTTYPDNEVVENSYSDRGLLLKVRSVTYNQDYAASLGYNALGQMVTKISGNNKVTTYEYYDDNAFPSTGPATFRLRRVSTPGLQDLTYSYDNIGNVSGINDALKSATQSFGYDDLHRLTSASSAAAPSFAYSYDHSAIGNLTSGEGRGFNFPAAGAARPHAPTGTADGSCAYGYDANGNLTTRTCAGVTRTLTWDIDNRLMQVSQSGATLASFTYDATGARVKKAEGAGTTVTPFPHYRTVNGVATKYYFANGQRVAERTGGNAAANVSYYHSDHLGSSNTVSNSSGAEVKATLFYPYGSTRTETGTKTIAHKYTGQERDDSTGLYYYGARYYDPQMMRFVSADNVIPSMADPQMFNRYSYVRGNPVKLVDPTGNIPVLYAVYVGLSWTFHATRVAWTAFRAEAALSAAAAKTALPPAAMAVALATTASDTATRVMTAERIDPLKETANVAINFAANATAIKSVVTVAKMVDTMTSNPFAKVAANTAQGATIVGVLTEAAYTAMNGHGYDEVLWGERYGANYFTFLLQGGASLATQKLPWISPILMNARNDAENLLNAAANNNYNFADSRSSDGTGGTTSGGCNFGGCIGWDGTSPTSDWSFSGGSGGSGEGGYSDCYGPDC